MFLYVRIFYLTLIYFILFYAIHLYLFLVFKIFKENTIIIKIKVILYIKKFFIINVQYKHLINCNLKINNQEKKEIYDH